MRWSRWSAPLALAATTLMGGGALAAELLRRSVAPPRLLRELMPARNRRIEVVHPDDLRTHARLECPRGAAETVRRPRLDAIDRLALWSPA